MSETQKEKDIFDKIMLLPIFKWFYPFYEKNKDILLYIFFGGVTTVVNFVAFYIFNGVMSVNEMISNVIAWVLAVLVAFFTNRIWVFHAETNGIADYMMQMFKFTLSRVTTLLIELAIIYIFVTRMKINAMLVKAVACIIIVILNYVFSKIMVFTKKAE